MNKDSLLRAWLLLAVSSLALAGAFAFLAAMTRMPVVRLLPSADYFQASLAAHVIFAIVVWLASFMCVLWVFTARQANVELNETLARGGFLAAASGVILIAFASIFGLGKPMLIEYVPLFEHPAFFLGLLLLALGISVTIISFAAPLRKSSTLAAAGMLYAGIITIIAFITVPIAAIFGAGEYRNLFWGAGHVIQFANTLAMAVAWFMLAEITLNKSFEKSAARKLFAIYLIFAAAMPFIYLLPANQPRIFTLAMGIGVGIPSFFIALMMLKAVLESAGSVSGLAKLPWREAGFSSLVFSLLLFGVGGLMGTTGSLGGTRVPAHYHASLGAAAVAYMGLTYNLLPKMGRRVYSERAARVQPYLYGLGLLTLISGFFWAGMHGVQRKAYFMSQDPTALIAMNFMGAGAIIAVIGGATFVANVLLPLLRK